MDDGLLTIYALVNTAPPGMKPAEKLVSVATAYYSERTVGVTRMYAARGANSRIDALVRCWNTEIPKNGKFVILEDGDQYRIDSMQKIVDIGAVDLTLIRLEDLFDVLAE